jgi:hypothetical protein
MAFLGTHSSLVASHVVTSGTYSQPQPETPSVCKMSSNSDYASGSLIEGWEVLVKHYGDVPEVEVELFFQSVLPPVKPGTIDNVAACLKNNGQLSINHAPVWTAFANCPSNSQPVENKVFCALSDIYQAMINTCEGQGYNRAKALELILSPNHTILSAQSNTSCPDGYLALGNQPSSNWNDVVVACEFKKKARPCDLSDVCTKCFTHTGGKSDLFWPFT